MAFVYLARDIRHDRAVAVKVLKPELAATVGGERFLREIRVAAQLQHPNILGLYDSGDADGLLYYIMPFVQGESLRDKLVRERQLAIEEAIRITREAAEALQHAHDRNIVHRDIKPENILLQNGHALVADFGIAKAVQAASGQKLTQTGTAIGTPHYMSPEQSLGGEVDGRADQYSLGCVLYELLTGQAPFDGPNAMAVIARHAMEQVPSIQVVRNTVPDQLEDAVYRALEKTAADRFPDMNALVEALHETEAMLTLERSAMRRAATPRTPMPGARTPRASARMPTPTAALPAAEVPGAERRKWVVGGALLAGALALGAAGWWRFGARAQVISPTGTTGVSPRKVAVLYFADRSMDSSLAPLASGLTEDLIHSLSSVQELEVVSQNGVRPFRGSDAPRDSIARALKVGTLVQGSVEPAGKDRVRVTARLIDATGVEFKDAATFEQAAADPLAMRDTITTRVADLLRTRLGDEIRLREQRSATRSADAWILMQRAEAVRGMAENAAARGDTLTAQRRFREADSVAMAAAERDPAWRAPDRFVGTTYYRLSRLAVAEPEVARTLIDSGMAIADRLIADDRADADAFELRGNLRYWRWLLRLVPDGTAADRLLQDARSDLETSRNLSPRQAGAWASLSHLYNQTSSITDVMLAAQRAYEADAYLDNAGTIIDRLFTAAYDLDQPVDARRWCEEGGRRFPEDARFQLCRLYLMTMRAEKPDIAAAWEAVQSPQLQKDPSTGSPDLNLGEARLLMAAILARSGLRDSARAVIAMARQGVAEASRRVGREVDPTRDLANTEAFAQLQLGDTAASIAALKLFLVANPEWRDGLAEDPGWWFRDLAGNAGFKGAVGSR